MEKAFDGCWGNRSSPLMPKSASSAYCRMESTKVGKLHLILNSSHDKKKDLGNQGKNQLIPPIQFLEPPTHSLKSTKSTGVPKEGRSLIQKEGKIRLTDCRMLGDMFANIHQLMLPCQSMSLLASPHIFYLVMLNPNATEMKERLSFTLYHTLHNEFFAHSSTKGKKSFKAVNNKK